ncbi:galactokinase [Spirosoma montaniterrae]|uniref:Galactokinase n=1 Tax=Spirosoma montaniterrae TaxID=1178516 RepID=A0A1P9WSB0_9BACT|nr:galactokinase [Spirosoma montaniterrae]AQG78242.1 galactokinase [Spirosoma montaniterrae]
MDLLNQLAASFQNAFNAEPTFVCSPGRVNLIGEHTDYNEGFVLPAAIDKAVYLAVGPRADNELHFIAHDLSKTYVGSLDTIQKTNTWADYLLGVIAQFQQANHPLRGINCVFGGTIPMGSGLSSSAALENGVGFALNELFDLGLDRISLLKLSQRAENEFVGAKVGIMDMFASMMGKAGHVIKLDCRSLDYAYAPLQMEGIRIVLCDSRVKHSLVTSEYNTRRAECEAGVRLLQTVYPNIRSLRDVTMTMLDTHLKEKEPHLYRRCAYVVQENQRLLDGVAALEAGDVATFGQLMYGSHEGLSRWYEVSCPELDILVGIARQQPGVLGARMMGGGFGGCTINLVEARALDAFANRITEEYKRQTGKDTYLHVCKIQDGTNVISL